VTDTLCLSFIPILIIVYLVLQALQPQKPVYLARAETPTTSHLRKQAKLFYHNFVKFQPTLIIFGTDMAKTIELCKVYFFPPRLVYVNALPCETQMLQIVTLCGNYLYQIVHFCIINSTEGATRFNNVVVLNILC